MLNNPLANLKDIHLPKAIGLWPPALGWYLVAFIIIVFLLSFLFFGVKKYHRYLRKKRTLKELDLILSENQDKPSQAMAHISQLTRRIMLAKFDRHYIANLSGDNWLVFLDERSGSKEFTQGIGRLLLTTPYQKDVVVDLMPIKTLLQRLIRQVL